MLGALPFSPNSDQQVCLEHWRELGISVIQNCLPEVSQTNGYLAHGKHMLATSQGCSSHCSLHPACSPGPTPPTGISFILQGSARWHLPEREIAPALFHFLWSSRSAREDRLESLAES